MSLNINPMNWVQGNSLIQNSALALKNVADSSSSVSFYNYLAQAINNQERTIVNNNTNVNNLSSYPPLLLASAQSSSTAVNPGRAVAKVDNTTQNQGPIKESDWLSSKPEDYTMEQFRAKIADANTRLSYLNPDQLPNFVTKPEAGISRSTDMVSPPTFEETNGGVNRIDHTMSGKVLTFIPCFEWRKTMSDGTLGTVYNQQTPWGFRTVFIRDGSGRTPSGYKDSGYAAEIERYMAGNKVNYAAGPKNDSAALLMSDKGGGTKRVAFLDTNEALIRLQCESDAFMKQEREDKEEDKKTIMV